MKPGGKLSRTTGLAAGKGLSRGTGGLSRETGLTRSTAIPAGRAPMTRTPRTPTPRKPRVTADVRALVLARSRERCEVAVTDACRARGRRLDSPEGTNQHHRLPGRMGGSKRAGVHEAANLLQVCGAGNTSGCHGWIEKNRTAALERGWLLPIGADPSAVPVTLWDGRAVLLGETYTTMGETA